MRNRIENILKKSVPILGIGIGYFIFVKLTGKRIPCVFYLLTDKYCPGCGITRMIMALSEFDFVRAAHCNLLVLCLLPPGLFLFGYKLVKYVKDGEVKSGVWEKVFYVVAFLLCIIFYIVRNSEWGTFLIP